ncbi:hypothetical protein KTT_43090 [Tengunoibacter tsumagoiensis]|uniref:Aminoglycoside phosphotransferase domain-containing protein n=1 Tax=Tengunoibacter tsumagoiensis TaxID=2014871 RepID=A0A402A5R7_9CHLR|nr:hypothetical protein KTT_43090 [Tengunoibacter tsumagoiensis]
MTAIEIERPDHQIQTIVVRQHGSIDLARNPQIAADEYKLLQYLESAGLNSPKPYYFDQSGKLLSTPYIVIEYIDGEAGPQAAPDFSRQFAHQLARIHQLTHATTELSFLPQQAEIADNNIYKRPEKLDTTLNEELIRNTLERAWPRPQQNPSVLLHGDFWPGNTLWKNGRLIATIDWEDAQIGDPLVDLANSRLEILWSLGRDAMQKFTQQYQALTTLSYSNLPYWDLYSALKPAFKLAEWAGDEKQEEKMRKEHQWFVEQALKKLS